MKETLKGKIGSMLPGKKGWNKFKSECVTSGICPLCGEELNPRVTDKYYKEAVLFRCNNCKWQNYKKNLLLQTHHK